MIIFKTENFLISPQGLFAIPFFNLYLLLLLCLLFLMFYLLFISCVLHLSTYIQYSVNIFSPNYQPHLCFEALLFSYRKHNHYQKNYLCSYACSIFSYFQNHRRRMHRIINTAVAGTKAAEQLAACRIDNLQDFLLPRTYLQHRQN